MVTARLGTDFGRSFVRSTGHESRTGASELRLETPAPPLRGGEIRSKRPGGLAAFLGLGRGGRSLASLGAIAAASIGFTLAQAPTPALADYVRPNADNVYELVRADATAPVLPAAAAGENADQVRALDTSHELSEQELMTYPLFAKLWNEITNVGEFEIAPSHLAKIMDYASSHNLHGDPLPQIPVISGPEGARMISEGNRALIKHLLQHPYYGAFIEQEARPLLEGAFGLPIESAATQAGDHPIDVGNFDRSQVPEWHGSNYQGNAVATLNRDLTSEFSLNHGWYEEGSNEQSAGRLTALLLHFGRAIHMYDQLDVTATSIDKVSAAFHQLPIFQGNGEKAQFLRDYFARDFNGSGMGLAESILRGFDPDQLPVSFPDATTKVESTTSLSMSSTSFTKPLSVIDEYRVAIGLNAAAVERFTQPVHNTVIGGVKGNYKTTLNELKPFASEVNFGVVLEFGDRDHGFSRDPQAAQLKPKPGFDFPIDAVTATGVSVNGRGATLRVYQQRPDGHAGERLSVEKVIHEEDGQPKYWTAVFRDSAGNEVAPDKVIGLLEVNGRPLGDGLANQTLDSGFWGYCDLNTGQTITGAIHQIPALDVDGSVYIQAGDRVLEVPKDLAQQIVNMGVADSAPRTKWAGHRHDRDASEVRWTRGNLIITDFGQMQGFDSDPRVYPRSMIEWLPGDHLQINFDKHSDHPPGVLRLQTASGPETIDASKVVRLIQAQNGEVTVVYNSSWTKTGKLLTPLSLDWAHAPLVAGSSDSEGGLTITAHSEAYKMQANDTLDRIYRQRVQATGVSYAAFKEANADLYAHAQSLALDTPVKIPVLMSDLYRDNAAPLGISEADFKAANPELYARTQAVAYDGETFKVPQRVIQNDPAHPFVGELVLKTVRGTEEIIPADHLLSVNGESEQDIRFTYFMKFVIDSRGVYATDASTGASVSNGARYVNDINLVVERGAERPDWAKDQVLAGIYGPLVRQAGDHIVFAAGTYGENQSSAWKGWYQVNDRGQVVNEGWISGMPDTAWGGLGDLDWHKQSSFVSELPWEMRVKLFVNGRKELRDNTPEGQALAQRLNLPSNWRDYITPADQIPAPVTAQPLAQGSN